MKTLKKSCGALLMSAFLLLGLGLCQSTANAASYAVSNVNSSGAGSLRAAIVSANSDGVDSDITFSATAFASLKTILLGGTELGLSNNGRLSITGPTAGVEISGNATNRVFSVGAGANVTLNKVTITRGKSDKGAGINNAGTLTLNNCTLTSNTASEYGGGVYSTSILNVNNCTISGNTATTQYGGGIQNGNDFGNANAILTMTGSLLRNNRAFYGGGLSIQTAATATVTNCTFYNNVADQYGAGVFNAGSTNLTNCTFVVNGNLSGKPGGGVYAFPGYYVGLTNCLGAQNTPDNFGQYVTDNGGNVQASSVQEAGLNSTGLANNGGPTQTIALVSRGTAVNAGVNGATSNFPYDQRGNGYPRIVGGSVDSGAYESSFTPVLVNNNGLTVAAGGSATITEAMLRATDTATNPLTYSITTGPSRGTVRLSGNPTNTFTQNDIAAGNVSYTQDGAVATSDSFVFNAGDGKGGYVTGTFAITITETPSLVVTTTADTEAVDGQTSLREAINFANKDGVNSAITFNASAFAAPRKSITLGGTALPNMKINGTLSISAPAAGVEISGNGASRVFLIDPDASITLTGLTISGGSAPDDAGGGVYNNFGTLLLDSCTLSDNTAASGGAIFTSNTMSGVTTTIRNCTLSGNTATPGTRVVGGTGGAIRNVSGLTIIESSTIGGNTTPAGSGAVSSYGDANTLTSVGNSIIAGNTGGDVNFSNSTTNSFVSTGYNLIGSGNATGNFNQSGDVTSNTDPGLAALADNGGQTPTRALLSTSPAVNTGNTTLTTDQRGIARPQGSADDKGAFEFVPTTTVSIGNASVLEGNTGTGTTASGTNFLRFPLTLSAASSSAVTVTYSTSNGTALGGTAVSSPAGADYLSATNATATIAAGQTSGTISIPVLGDTVNEPNETLGVTLSNPSGAALGTAIATGTIQNDDNAPTLSIQDGSAKGSAGNVKFQVTLSNPALSSVSVAYATGNGTAIAGTNYSAQSGTLTFTAGQTTKTITITITGLTSTTSEKKFLVTLSNPTGATLARSSATGTILAESGSGVAATPSGATITLSGLRRNRITGRYVQPVLIQNNTGAALAGPLYLVLDNIVANLSLYGPGTSGYTVNTVPAGNPYFTLSGLAQGASQTIEIEFVNPSNGPVSFQTRVLKGPGTP